MPNDWREVAELDPHGYAEFLTTNGLVAGPVARVVVLENDVVKIHLLWVVRETAPGKFVRELDRLLVISGSMTNFEIEDSEFGKRIRFFSCQPVDTPDGPDLLLLPNYIYIENLKPINPLHTLAFQAAA